ncbi:AraC family transcriptional regulator [Luteimonas salinilitoris]|uniref:AraC family transcriptional regulator n=1 Tax=Luteimonas salinilitoris TaxID=3237697 RepID=UPI00351C6CCA
MVQHFWIVRWDLQGAAPQVRETLPHPNVHLVFEPGRTRIHGIHSGRFTRVLEQHGAVFGIKFRPGAFRPFLQRPVSTLRNRSVSLQEVFGIAGAPLEASLFAQEDDARQAGIAEAFLGARLPPVDDDVTLVGEMVDGICADRGITTVEHLLARWPMSRRRLQRLFNEYVGIGAKWVVNRYRMHEALERLARGGAADWAGLALELGYFDQPHFIRDFKALVGCTPTEYMGRFPPPAKP